MLRLLEVKVPNNSNKWAEDPGETLELEEEQKECGK